ncbi:hypothetical protein QWZ08_26260 [Ferruginibacter paludis]|uniref:hypothetical protein n=1 Tax=Ferruginibacter paludis TaxID=1310417 RepID=UPI0025B33A98|nr:hypothetical protein [Ferruginibacter paludis]MDN3659176.1 hypothetical protein [Ferruginibacter paludis]
MMNSGFIIMELRLTGNNLQPAVVSFAKGLNVISGPSNTGKTYIYQCINYMLGSSDKPKPIKLSLPYSSLRMKIQSHDGRKFILQSDLKGGDFLLYSEQSDKPITLARKHNPDSTENISAFLLGLNNLKDKKIRTNAQGKTRKISYRDIVRFLIVDEARIITDKSPITSGQYTTPTEEKSTFKLILSGNDDSDIIESLSKDEVKYRRGKIEMLTELISSNRKELDEIPDNIEPEDRILKVDDTIQKLKEEHERLKNVFTELDSGRSLISGQISNVKSLKVYNDEVLIRSEILKQQYETDSKRLNSTIEASYLLMNNPSVEENCPVCSSPLGEKNIEPELVSVIKACELEIGKINNLTREVAEAELILKEENQGNIGEIERLQNMLDAISEKIENGVSVEMGTLFTKISELNGLKANLSKAVFLKEKIVSFEKQKEIISLTIAKKEDNKKFEDITTSSLFELSKILNNILKSCSYPSINGVTFSETKDDFVISGEDRELSGKGYRAITYASFLIALQELLYSKDYSIGPSILDSPLVTYRKPSAQGEGIAIDLAMDFYRYLATNSKVPQVIILENEEPPSDISHLINHIPFTQNLNSGRYGFIPLAPRS